MHLKLLLHRLLLLTLPACTTQYAHLVVAPPNHGIVLGPAFDPSDSVLHSLGFSRQFHVPVGPPDASLYVRIIDPPAAPKGTILVLHGFLLNSDLMTDQAKHLAAAGYRAVLVDLRGHGRSTGPFITFGVVESRDLTQLLNALTHEHLLAGPVGVFGLSYGAATAIQLAGRDPRIAAVVALAPFATFEEEAPAFGRTFIPALGWKSDADYAAILAEAGRLANFDPAKASPIDAITHTRAPILLIHGDSDSVIHFSHSQRLHAAAPDHSELVIVPGGGHASVWMDLDDNVRKRAVAWFDTHLAPLSDREHRSVK
jgi:pimeloyl-ACP methyl ester carboxylesterase